MEVERKKLKVGGWMGQLKGSRCGNIGGGTQDLSGLLGGLNPPEG